MNRYFVVFLVLTFIGPVAAAHACTTIVFRDGDALLYARNLDWNWKDGLVIVNQRGIAKTAFVQPGEVAAEWTSTYGSVTFNQFGREMPFGGINEAGLVISQMMLLATEYPEPDHRPSVNMLQWIQYQLDNYDSVNEVLASDASVRVEPPTTPARIHYLICDAAGNAATVEFLKGRLVCRRGEELGLTALTNNCYDESAAFAQKHLGLGGELVIPNDAQSLPRFARAAMCSRRFNSGSPEEDRDFGFDSLRRVAQGKRTVWSIVYDIPARRVHFRTVDNPKVRWFDLEDFDFSPDVPPRFMDVNAAAEDHVAGNFEELTEQRHRMYLRSFFEKPDLQKQFGDLTPMSDGLIALLRTYRPAVHAWSPPADPGAAVPIGSGN